MRKPKPIHIPVPRCPYCDVPWIIRWSLSLATGQAEWIYQSDCKHNRQIPVATGERAPMNVPNPYLRGV